MSIETIKYQGKDYATVPGRLKEFREKNPRASIKSKSIHHEDGSVEFVTLIVMDKSDEFSADADGHAIYSAEEIKKTKAFEKLETISVGRALAKLGYLNNGQIASTEEMVEFENYQTDKYENAVIAIESATKRDEFQTVMSSLNAAQQRQITPIIKARMAELKKKELQHAG